MLAGAGDRREAFAAEPVHLAAQRQQLRRGGHLGLRRRPAPASSSQCRKRQTATASRAWAARAPCCSTVVLARLRQQAGVRPGRHRRAGLAQRLREPDRRAGRIDPHALAGQPRQAPGQRLAPGHRRRALPSQARVSAGSLAGSMNSSVPPSACTRAKPSANGVNGTSPPRMFSSQAIEAGSVSTAASCLASRQQRWRSPPASRRPTCPA